MQERPVNLSHDEKQTIETIRTFGSVDFFISDWKMLARLEASGRVQASEPWGKNNHYKTATYIPLNQE